MRSRGQSLSEYMLAASLIAVVSIATLSYFATDLAASMPGLLDRIFGGGAGGSTAVASGSSTPGASTPTGNGPSSTTPLTSVSSSVVHTSNGTVTITLESGLKLDLYDFPTDATAAVETSGANGTSLAYLAQLDTLIQELESADAMNDADLAVLKQLSRDGHELATIQGKVEQGINEIARQVSGSPNFHEYTRDPSITPDSDQRSLYDLSIELMLYGNDDPSRPYADTGNALLVAAKNQNDYSVGGSMHNFLDTYAQAHDQGALNDPSINAVITKLSSDIAAISSNMQLILEDNPSMTRDLSQFNNALSSQLKTPPYSGIPTPSSGFSEYSHASASSICTTGNGQSTGTTCN